MDRRYVYKDGNYVMSGDAHGLIKIWDFRKRASVLTLSLQSNEEKNKPISYLHVTRGN